jgi:hypothetical protein
MQKYVPRRAFNRPTASTHTSPFLVFVCQTGLEGKYMFPDSCRLRVGFSSLKELKIPRNTSRAKDFSVASEPSLLPPPTPEQGSAQYEHSPPSSDSLFLPQTSNNSPTNLPAPLAPSGLCAE